MGYLSPSKTTEMGMQTCYKKPTVYTDHSVKNSCTSGSPDMYKWLHK
jgi:hypothetical protein